MQSKGPFVLSFALDTAGSYGGTLVWAYEGGVDDGLGLLMVAPTIGSGLGGWMGSGARRSPGLGAYLGGAMLRLVGGVLGAHAGEAIDRDSWQAILMGFGVGQGLATALIGRL